MIHQEKTTVLIIEPDFALRDCLQMVIAIEPDFSVCGLYKNFEASFVTLKYVRPTLIIMNIESGSADSIRLIRAHLADTRIMLHGDPQDRVQLFKLLESGAVGFIDKGTSPEELIRCLRDVRDGGSLLPMRLARPLVERFQWQPLQPLTKTETKVLKNLRLGKSYRQIADDLGVTRGTISRQIYSAYKKMGVHSRVDAIRQVKFYKL